MDAMETLLLLPDGVGVRNFLHAAFLGPLTRDGTVHVLSTIAGGPPAAYRGRVGGRVRWGHMPPFRESGLSTFLRYSLAYAQMHWGDTQAMRYNRVAPIRGSWRHRAVHRSARLTGRAAASPRGIRLLDRWHCREVARLPEVGHYRRIFIESRPSVLLCSHQRPPQILPAVVAARSLGIPTATFISSWDNLTSKGRIAAPFDHYLVWSELMRDELLQYYPDVSPDRVYVVGTPQFDPYADESLLVTRDEFFRSVGADPARPLMCYSGGDEGTSPDDPEYVRVLMGLVLEGQVRGDPQVLVRPSPVDDCVRYEAVRRDFPEILFSRPDWVHEVPGDWSRVIPLPGDVRLLANLTRHADLNVNLASTMTLDFAIRDKPVVNVAFDLCEPPRFGVPLVEYYYRFEHYRPVVESGAARIARSPAELAEHINAYLENPGLDGERRRRLVALEVEPPLGSSSAKVVDALESIARRGR